MCTILMTFYCSFRFPLSLMKLVLDMTKYFIKRCVYQRKVSCYKSTKMLIHEIFSLLLLDFNRQKLIEALLSPFPII